MGSSSEQDMLEKERRKAKKKRETRLRGVIFGADVPVFGGFWWLVVVLAVRPTSSERHHLIHRLFTLVLKTLAIPFSRSGGGFTLGDRPSALLSRQDGEQIKGLNSVRAVEAHEGPVSRGRFQICSCRAHPQGLAKGGKKEAGSGL